MPARFRRRPISDKSPLAVKGDGPDFLITIFLNNYGAPDSLDDLSYQECVVVMEKYASIWKS